MKLIAGLGNQMFQYAAGRALSLQNKTDLYLDLDWFYYNDKPYLNYMLDKFNVQFKIAKAKQKPFYVILWKNRILDTLRYPISLFCKIANPNHRVDNSMHPLIHKGMWDFNPEIGNLRKKKLYLEGFWHSEEYFKDISEVIRKDFTLKTPIDDKKNLETIDMMKKSSSVSIHVRRGDYLLSDFGGICEKPYYQKAIDYIKSKIDNPTFFVFGNDYQWCKENLNMGKNVHFIDWNNKDDSYKDMILMSNCKNNIIANSSFSRRGAWLNNNPDKIVIAPKKRHQKLDYKDIIPKEWIRI